MATFQAELYAHVQADAGVVALIGDRMYPVSAPPLNETDSIPDTLIYRLTARRPEFAQLSGGLVMFSDGWELISISETYDRAHQIADATVASLNYLRGPIGSGSVRLTSSELEDAVDDDDNLLGFYAVILRFQFRYQHTA